HDALGLVALADHLDHHALAPLAVHHVVPYPQSQLLSPRGARRRGAPAPQGGLDDAGAPALGQPGLAPAFDHRREVLGDLLEEAAGRVVLRRAEQRPAPRVGELEPLAGPGATDVVEAGPLL